MGLKDTKTTYIYFKNKNNKKKLEKFIINNLTSQNKIKFFSIAFDENLNFHNHIQNTINKTKYSAIKIQKFKNSDTKISLKILRTLYIIITRSIIDYSLIILHNKQIPKLENIHNKTIKNFANMKKSTTTKKALQQFNVIPLQEKLKILYNNWHNKITSFDTTIITSLNYTSSNHITYKLCGLICCSYYTYSLIISHISPV